MEDNFSTGPGVGVGGWFQDDSKASHLLGTASLSLSQLPLSSSGIRPRRAGTPSQGTVVKGKNARWVRAAGDGADTG